MGLMIECFIRKTDEFFSWLKFVVDDSMLKRDLVEPLMNEAAKLKAIFIASRKKSRMKSGKRGLIVNPPFAALINCQFSTINI
jgi:hypothetical protein